MGAEGAFTGAWETCSKCCRSDLAAISLF